jgi:hypothetical protein
MRGKYYTSRLHTHKQTIIMQGTLQQCRYPYIQTKYVLVLMLLSFKNLFILSSR